MSLTRFSFYVACALALAVPLHAQERLVPRLTVTGEANVTTVPDLAQIHTGVTSQSKTAKEASETNSKTANALLVALHAAAIEDKDIQTTGLTLQPTYEGTYSSGRGRINGFQASNQVTIKVRDITKLADIVDRVIAAGATDIGGIDFIVSAPSPALDAGRIEAITDARRKAEIYAKAAGVTLGRVVGVSENNASPEPILMQSRASAAAPIMPGEKTLRLIVTVSYELAN